MKGSFMSNQAILRSISEKLFPSLTHIFRAYDQHIEKVLEVLQSKMHQIPKGFELDLSE